MRVFFGIVCYLSLILPLVSQSQDSEKDATHPGIIKSYFKGWSPAIRIYGREILESLLSHSKEKYGPYTLEYVTDELTTARGQFEMSLGKNINLDFTPMPSSDSRRKSISQEQIPLFNGLLGLRRLIVQKTELGKYSNTVTLNEFRSYIVGQGKGWPDVNIYNHANMKVVESNLYNRLFPMLAANRYHYLPLSIIEIDEALRDKKEFADKLTVAPNIYIFYPIPVYLSVTKKYTELTERVSYGLKKSIENGEFNRILYKHLSSYINSISPDTATLFYMENPTISTGENRRMTDEVLNKYFSEKTRIFNLNSL